MPFISILVYASYKVFNDQQIKVELEMEWIGEKKIIAAVMYGRKQLLFLKLTF